MTYTVDRAIALHGEGCNSGGEAPGGGVTGPDVEMISYWADLMGSVDRCDLFIYVEEYIVIQSHRKSDLRSGVTLPLTCLRAQINDSLSHSTEPYNVKPGKLVREKGNPALFPGKKRMTSKDI